LRKLIAINAIGEGADSEPSLHQSWETRLPSLGGLWHTLIEAPNGATFGLRQRMPWGTWDEFFYFSKMGTKLASRLSQPADGTPFFWGANGKAYEHIVYTFSSGFTAVDIATGIREDQVSREAPIPRFDISGCDHNKEQIEALLGESWEQGWSFICCSSNLYNGLYPILILAHEEKTPSLVLLDPDRKKFTCKVSISELSDAAKSSLREWKLAAQETSEDRSDPATETFRLFASDSKIYLGSERRVICFNC
jgi:hypothetical protein